MDAKVMGGKYKRVDIIVGAVCADHVHLRFCTTGNADVIMEHMGLFCCICSDKSGAGAACTQRKPLLYLGA